MTAEWYYRTPTGAVEGPVTAVHLKQLAQTGEIAPGTPVRKGVDSRWVTADKVKGLLDTPPQPEPTKKTDSAPWGIDKSASEAPARPKPAPLVRRLPADIEPDEEDRPVPARQSDPSEVTDAEYTVSALAKKRSPLLLIGAGVGGTLLIVGLVALGISMFGKKDEGKPQQPVAQTPNEKNGEPTPPKKDPPSADGGTSTSPSLSTPEAAVKGYLAARTWEERLPYVLNADRVRPEMAKVYKNTQFKAENFLPGTIVAVENRNAPVGGKCTVTVDVSTASPNVPRWTYLLVRTPDGFKVDWEASQEQSKKEQNEALETKLRELNPVIDIEVLRCKQSNSRCEIEFRLTNRSMALFTYVAVTMSIHNAKGEYLGNNFTNATNVRAGQSIVKSISFDNVKVGEVASWKMGIEDVTIDRGDGQRKVATTVFKLNEQLAGSDKGYQRRLESRLAGHWRDSGSHYYCHSTKAEAVIVGSDGVRNTFAYSVIERNYSAGTFQLRFVLNDGTGHQRTFKIKDKKTTTNQPTHIAIEAGKWRELKDEIKDKLTEDWTYVDERETP